ncbi:MAG: MORN motif precursor, partial [Marinovum sp.]|nr:MORN motif precursor [Marinovum sp.]
MFHGQGTYSHANGNQYVGAFKDGKRNGQGILSLAGSDSTYVGTWRDNKQSGQGTYTFADGGQYVGS